VLTRQEGRGEASLRLLIERELAPHDMRGRKLKIDGPDVLLTPRAGLALAMAVHELASNASKYGALSTPKGRLAITWTTDGSAALHILWTEANGPAVHPPARSGFGTTLIERTLGYELDGNVNREFLPSGLRCTIDLPLTDEVGHLPGPGDKRGITP
jgi:two-component system CheB/CheR fusion protein